MEPTEPEKEKEREKEDGAENWIRRVYYHIRRTEGLDKAQEFLRDLDKRWQKDWERIEEMSKMLHEIWQRDDPEEKEPAKD